MRTRRYRKGGAGMLDMFKSVGKEVSKQVGIGVQNTLSPEFQSEIDKLKGSFQQIDEFKKANPDKLPDVKAEVSDLGSLSGYSEASLINAIVLHNTAYKIRQLDNTLGSECGPKCAERAQSIRLALRKLVEYSERSDALGYIGVGRGIVNNSSYLANSTVSSVVKAPERLKQAADYSYNSLFTRKVAPEVSVQPQMNEVQPQMNEVQPQVVQPQIPMPVKGGRRRKRTCRRR